MEQRKFKYDFFISYKHGQRDSRVSGYLQKKLESYKIPKEIQKRCGKEKITRVFRDKEELSVTIDLTQEIEEQLKNTEYLIVMCSPQSKQSVWVNREVETFLRYRGWEYVLPVLIEGEPQDSFPEILNEREMLAADLRGKTFAQVKRKCKREMLRLLAPALGCSYDELRQRNRAYASRRMAATAIGLAAVALGFGAYAWRQSVRIQENYWKNMESQAGLLAEKSSELLKSGDRDAALLVALEALPESEASEEKPLIGKAQIALEEALYLYYQESVTAPQAMHTLKMDHSMKTVYTLNEERDVLISCDEKNIIYIWNLVDGTLMCRYTGFHDTDENCTAVLGGADTRAYLCSGKQVICFDYEKQEVLWKIHVEAYREDFFGYWSEYTLSPEKDRLALASDDAVWIISAKSGELQDYYKLHQEDCNCGHLVWNPNGKELALADDGFIGQGCVLLLDLENGQETILKTFENWRSMDIAYQSEDVLCCAWTDASNLSIGFSFDYAEYYVEELDCRSGETLWQMEEKTVMRDTSPEIQFVQEERDGERFDFTIVIIGSEVIAIRDRELWAEFAYDSAIVGRIPYGLTELHITQNGGIYQVAWRLRFTLNEFFDHSELGLDNVYYAEGITGNGIVLLPGSFGGGAAYVYALVQDEDYVEVENSGQASYIDYSPSSKYRIAMDYSDADYNDKILNIWDMESGEHIYRQEFLYDSQSSTGEKLENFGFINDQYFYYSTLLQVAICDVNTLEKVAVYDQPVGEIGYFAQINQVCGADGENPGVYFSDKAGNLYYFPVQGDGVREILTLEEQKQIYAERYNAEPSRFRFAVNPTGTHVFFTCDSTSSGEREINFLIWDVGQGKLCGAFPMPYEYGDFAISFSEDGTQMLFQNKEQGLQVMDLEDGHVEAIPIQGENHQGFWFSHDKRYVFVYTYDYFLRVYDRETQKQTLNLECDAMKLNDWYFEGENLYISATYAMSQPVMNCYRETEAGVYECFSVVSNCERITKGKAYVRPESTYKLYAYPHRGLDEMISMAKEILDGRELTPIERQRYSIEQ